MANKEELIQLTEEHGVHKLFEHLNIDGVSKRGDYISCVCPFHEGADNENGFVYTNNFGGYCFTNCNRKFDVFDIIMKVKAFNFVDAMEYLGDYLGVGVSYYSNRNTGDGAENKKFLKRVKKVKSVKNNYRTPIDPKVFDDIEPRLHKMLRNEGYDNEVKDYFNIGYARGGYFDGRITIPVDYVDGGIITISGRGINLEGDGGRKYLIYPNTDKSVTLYNISRATPYIEITNEVILVEGFKSVWRLHQWGIRNVVATMGSSLSSEQRKLLLKLSCRIVVCGDNDKAGKKLNQQVINLCSKYSDVEVMDFSLVDAREKDSLDDITKSQFELMYTNRK